MIAGVILAGGRSSRMGGGDKPLLPLGDTTVLGHVVGRLSPQVERLALNANGDPARFAAYPLPVIADSFGSFDGPLAGILAGLEWAKGDGVSHLATAAGDTPFLPRDLVARLAEADTSHPVVAASAGRAHPTFALWPVALGADLRSFLTTQPSRRVMDFLERQNFTTVDFAVGDHDPFFNINRPDDLATAEKLAALA